MRPDLFITRQLLRTDALHKALRAAAIIPEARSLVEFKPIAFRVLPPADWVMFSSSRGVEFTAERLKKLGRSLPAGAKIAAVGPSTAETVEAYFSKPDLIGTGVPDETMAMFIEKAGKNNVVLFLQAERPAGTVPGLFSITQKVIEKSVYRNRPVACPMATEARYLLFTSPMNAKAYFGANELLSDQKVLAIGQTTEVALMGLSVPVHAVAPLPDTDSLIKWLPTVVTPARPRV